MYYAFLCFNMYLVFAYLLVVRYNFIIFNYKIEIVNEGWGSGWSGNTFLNILAMIYPVYSPPPSLEYNIKNMLFFIS